MKKVLLFAAFITPIISSAQNNTAYNIIEGSKTLVDLIRVFKTPRTAIVQTNFTEAAAGADSCFIKSTADFCVKNSTDKPLLVSLYRRNGNGYDPLILTMSILPKNKECLYDIKSGIYKMKLAADSDDDKDDKKVFREGEIRISACDNNVQNIQNR